MVEIKKVAAGQDVADVVVLAREIWTAHYVPIIGQAQVDYMVAEFQSEAAISQQINEGYEYYLAVVESQNVGYLAVVPEAGDSALMISKIYVKKAVRGQGVGYKMLEFAESLCQERGLATLWLTVNKYNAASIAWYERMGFVNAGALVADIGGGYVMDDFKMEKALCGSC